MQLGALVGLVLSGLLTDLLGYRGTLAIYAPLAALGLGIAWWTLPRVASGYGPDGAAKPAAGAGPGTLATLRRLDPRLLVPAYVNFASLFAGSGVVMSTLGVSFSRTGRPTRRILPTILYCRWRRCPGSCPSSSTAHGPLREWERWSSLPSHPPWPAPF